jgi:hypothetical protein
MAPVKRRYMDGGRIRRGNGVKTGRKSHQTMQRGLSGGRWKNVRLIALRGSGETLGIPAHQGWQTLSGSAVKDSSSSGRSSS